MKVLSIILVSVVLTACAVTPKPEFSDNQYQTYVNIHVGITECNTKGFMDPTTSAHGISMLNRDLVKYTYDWDRVLKTKTNNKEVINSELCNKMALYIQGDKQRLERIRQNSEPDPIQPIMPQQRTTFCNHIGNQLLCNSY